MHGPVRPEKTLEPWNPVSQKLSLSEVHIDYQGDLRQHPTTVDSRADGSAFAWQKIGRSDARGAKPARGHLIAVEGQGQEVRYAWIRLVQKGLRSRQDGSAGGEGGSAAPHHRSLRSDVKGAS